MCTIETNPHMSPMITQRENKTATAKNNGLRSQMTGEFARKEMITIPQATYFTTMLNITRNSV